MKLVLVFLTCIGVYFVLGDDQKEEIAKAFKELDADGDGKVTYEEIQESLEQKKTRSDADHVGMAKSIYEFYDKDRDGHVSLKEFLPRHDEL